MTLSAKTIAIAFTLPMERFQNTTSSFSSGITSAWQSGDDRQYLSAGKFFRGVCIGLSVLVLIAFFIYRQPRRTRSVVTKSVAPTARLPVGSVGTVEGKTYRLAGHALVEIAQVDRIFDRHEYQLLEDEGERALLVQGLKPGDSDWFLFTLLHPLDPMTPIKAANVRSGERVNVDGLVGPASDIAQVVLRQTDGSPTAECRSGMVFFSFTVSAGVTPTFVRWNQDGISFYRGRFLPAKEVEAAFRPVPKS